MADKDESDPSEQLDKFSVASFRSTETPSIHSLPNNSACDNKQMKPKRAETRQKHDELNQMFQNCNRFHQSALLDLSNNKLSYEALDAAKAQLNDSKLNVVKSYNEWRAVLGSIETDLKTRNTMDRIIADNDMLTNKVLDQMSILSARNKTVIDSNSTHLTLSDTVNTQHVVPMSTNTHSIVQTQRLAAKKGSEASESSYRSMTSRSKSSKSSSASIKLMQLKAKTQAEVLKRKLETNKTTQNLEIQAQQLAQAIENSKIQAELEAAKVEEQIMAEAIAEEEVEMLFNPPQLETQSKVLIHANQPPVTHTTQHESLAAFSVHSTQKSAMVQPAPPQLVFTSPQAQLVQQNTLQITPNATERPAQGLISPSLASVSSNHSDQAFADMLAKSIHSIKLKPAEPIIFEGDPLTYIDWKVAFEGLIESCNFSPLQKLAYLQQYLGGKAKEAVSGYFKIGTEYAYTEAKRKLDERFGQPFVISEAYLSKLEDWSTIKEHDGEELQRLADFLESCKVAMKQLPELHCLNDRRENIKVLRKLPLSIGRRWVKKATHIESSTLKFPSLCDFCTFLTQEAKVATSSLSQALTNRAPSSSHTSSNKTNRSHTNTAKRATALLALDDQSSLVDCEQSLNYKPVKYPCVWCNLDNHNTRDCFRLRKQSSQEIEELFIRKNLCFSCAKPGHRMADCKHPEICKQQNCGQKHLTLLHSHIRGSEPKTSSSPTWQSWQNRDNQSKLFSSTHSYHDRGSQNKTSYQIQPAQTSNTSAKSLTNSSASNQSATARSCTDNNAKPVKVMSWMIPVYVSTNENPTKEILVYALLDSGSNNTFVTEETLAKLNARTMKQDISIGTLTDIDGAKSTRDSAEGLVVRGFHKHKKIKLPTCISQHKIPCNRDEIPNALSVQDWPHLRSIAPQLISEAESRSIQFGLLIGANLPQAFISREDRVGADHEPFARLTDLGWTLMGTMPCNSVDRQTVVNLAVVQPTTRSQVTFKVHGKPDADDDTLEDKMLQLFSADFQSSPDDNSKSLSIDDVNFLQTMNRQIHIDKDGHVTMPLPFKYMPGPNKSKAMATQRFKLLQKKLSNPTFSEHYYKFMSEIISQGDAEIVPLEEESNPDSWYIPHFGVYHPKKPGKIRVVFDGAAKVGGRCLNDHLLQGPDQLNSLIGILLRFRKEQVGVTCDIARMFHQFHVSPEHRDYLRFLWYNDHGEIVTYRMKVHIFGATSSPACATFGLRALCDMSPNANSSAKAFIKKDFYVDDGLASLPNADTAKTLMQDAISICKEGNLRLHKFSSNSSELLDAFPETERNIQDTQTLDPDSDSQPTERTLGLLWSLKSDCFKFSSSLKNNPNTRRGVLSTIASIYDPLGFLSPFILQGKNILQDMCRIATSWDDPLSSDLLPRWEKWKNSLPELSNIQINRCYKPTDFGEISKAEIHNFSDASTGGYGCVSYLRLVNPAGKVHCSLLMSKARVAPIKPITIPRLELQAAVSASQLAQLISSELDMNVTNTFWTDSKVVLGYIKNTTKRFHVYVTNRIQQVRDNCDPEKWFYVPTAINPADHSSRGMNISQLMESNWFSGPQFLWEEPMQMPAQLNPEVSSDDPEIKSMLSASPSQHPTLYQRLHRFSSWSTAVKVADVFIRKAHSMTGKLSSQESTPAAVTYIVKCTQDEYFPELQCLKEGKPIARTSKIFNLNPFLDQDGVMRVGGRLKNSLSLQFLEKHPIILPKTGHFTQILLHHLHEQTAHQGRGMTLAKMRASGYWVIGARNLITSLTHKCVVCRIFRAKPSMPQMAPLPSERSTESPPFSYCGIDCFGPFLVKDRRTEIKRYGLMVTCLASRAVHLELLDDMSTSAFINAIRNVIAIRGPIREIKCDQGTNFIGAAPQLAQHGVLEFKFNPPTASHMGGVWERMIRSARNVLAVLMKQHSERLDTSGLRTLMYEVMAIINSRPLSAVTEEEVPLSPNLLLTMKSDIILPPPDTFTDSDIYSRKRWRVTQHLANLFWQRWRSEYLATLQARQKWVNGSNDVKIGDVVLVKDDSSSRNEWPLGKVVECFRSSDDQVRSVKLLMGNRKSPKRSEQFLTRPVSKIIELIKS